MSYDEQRISDQIDGGLHQMNEMEKKQTAVQWLIEKLFNLQVKYLNDEISTIDYSDSKDAIKNQALQMEREQIEEAFNKGYDEHEYNNDHPKYGADPDVYYTLTFKP